MIYPFDRKYNIKNKPPVMINTIFRFLITSRENNVNNKVFVAVCVSIGYCSNPRFYIVLET